MDAVLVCPECRTPYPSDASVCRDHGCALVPLDALSEDDAPLKAGAMVGEYQIERRLGAGTFGAVYAGEQPLIGKKVAIKVLHKRFASNAAMVSRFVSEARAVNRIRHKNIIDIFSFGMLADEQPYFVMELLDGMTLGELLDRRKRLAVAEALAILRGIAAGLDAAHEAGITHRDLKPDNIFLAIEKGGDYFPKVLDFGVAKLISDEMAHKTATGVAIGTPSYMAPEQCRGKNVDHRADIYALGVVIHEMLTGERLFQADSAVDVLLKHVSEPPRPMSEVCPELPKELDAPVLAMLAKSPRQRPSSAGAAVAALAELAVDRDAAAGFGPASPARVVDRKAQVAGSSPGALENAKSRGEAVTVVTDRVRTAAATRPSRDPALSGPAQAPELTAPSAEGDGPPPSGDAANAPVLNGPAMTSDGRFAMSSAKGNTIKIWDLRTGKAIHTFHGSAGAAQDGAPAPAATSTPLPGARSSRPPAPAAGASLAESRGIEPRSLERAAADRAAAWRAWALIAAGVAAIVAFIYLLLAR